MIELKHIGITVHIYDDQILATHRYDIVSEWKPTYNGKWIRVGDTEEVSFQDIYDVIEDWIDEGLESQAERDEDIQTLNQWSEYEPTTY